MHPNEIIKSNLKSNFIIYSFNYIVLFEFQDLKKIREMREMREISYGLHI